ncbi:unnamed protein product [Calypogeia fissa]
MFSRQRSPWSSERSPPTWWGGGQDPVALQKSPLVSPKQSSTCPSPYAVPELQQREAPQGSSAAQQQCSAEFSFISDASCLWHDTTAPRDSNFSAPRDSNFSAPRDSIFSAPRDSNFSDSRDPNFSASRDFNYGTRSVEDFTKFGSVSAQILDPTSSAARGPSNGKDSRKSRHALFNSEIESGHGTPISTPDYNGKEFVVPVSGSETPLTMANQQPWSRTPYLQRKLSKAKPEDVEQVALRMCFLLKERGLAAEAERAFQFSPPDDGANLPAAAATANVRGLTRDEDGDEEELVGMDYILKDGIVDYLRDVAKLTPPIPQQVVRFYDINYSTKVSPQPPGFATFGAKLFNCFFGLFAAPFRKKETPRHLDILKDISGYIMPGSMTLLLGPPGSGKSSLLKVLAGRAETNKATRLEGTVLFNNRVASEILLTRLIAYVNGQLNQHLPFLTVRETLQFAGDCTQGLKPGNFTPQMRRFFASALVEGQDPYLEYILHVLGLKGIEHQLVGTTGGPDQNGISETERNRLTTAEIAMGTYSVMLYDQPCFGQESLATYDLVSTLRAISRFQQCSAVMSLVQLSPEVFDLFDRVILLGEGQVLYQGPRHDVLSYFKSHGFVKPEHMDAGDFLMEIAAGEGIQYLRTGHVNPSLDNLVKAYKLSEAYKDMMRVMHSEDVIHALWVETEPNLGMTMRKKNQKKKTVFVNRTDIGLCQMSHSTPLNQDGNGDFEVVVSRLPRNKGQSSHGAKLKGIESSGAVEIGDLVTGISLPNEDMVYLNGSESIGNQRHQASNIAKLLANAQSHVRLQVERIWDPQTMEEQEAQAKQFSRKYIQSWRDSTITLIKRQIKVHCRVALLMQLRLLQVLVMGLFGGALFYKVGGKYMNLKMNATRSIGFVTTGNLMLVSLVQLPLFMSQRAIFYKQRQQRFFRVSSYVISQSVVGIPQALLEAILYSSTIYFLASLKTGDQGVALLEYVLLMFVVSCYGTAQVLALSGLSALLEQASALSGLLVAIFILFSGFIIYPSTMPKYWRWVAQLNPLRWANIAFCANQFERLYKDPCNEHKQDIFFCEQYPGPSQTVGLAFLDHYELLPGEHWFWTSIAILTGFTILMLFLAYIVYIKIEHTSVTPSLPSQTRRNVQLMMPKSTETDARHETQSGISWAGFIVQGDVDLTEEVHRLEKSTVQGAQVKSLRNMMQHDSESLCPVPELVSCEDHLSWKYSSLPVTPATISFYNISLWVWDTRTKAMRQRLDRVSGYAKPGKMLALMGGHKSGTTTLLKCLAHRGVHNKRFSGQVFVNGCLRNSSTFSRTRGFVERLDAHQPFLTIRESLLFSAALRLPRGVHKGDRLLHINLILDLLELTEIADQLVGSLRDATGKTFELAKKITIAVELAANPSILFLDEPTSGLDGLSARNIIHAMQTIAASGRTIITTIQHPSSRMLSAFQKVLLLSPGGQQVYFGPVGANCSHLLEYFGSIPKVPKYDMKKNPVTHVFDILGCGIKTRAPIHDFSEVYSHSSLASTNMEDLKLLREPNKRKAFKLVSTSGYPAAFYMQAVMVFLRTQKFLWRNVGYTFGRIVSSIAVGLIMGLVFVGTSNDNTLSLTSRTLYIYAQVILIGIVTANNVVPQLGTDRLAYFRERRAGMYHPILYPISWAIAEIPYILLATLIFVSIGNGLAGIGTDSASNFIRYWMSLFVFTVAMAYFAMLITIATPVPMLASFIVSIFTSIWITASGVVVTLPIFQGGWLWTFWTDPFQYVINTLTAVGFHCDVSRPQCLACVPGQPCPACSCDQLKDLGFTFSWAILKANRGIDYSRVPLDFAALTGMAALFAALAFITFVSCRHNRPEL